MSELIQYALSDNLLISSGSALVFSASSCTDSGFPPFSTRACSTPDSTARRVLIYSTGYCMAVKLRSNWGRSLMISYLMSYPRDIVCWTLHCDLKALDCFDKLSLRDGAMASLKLSQIRYSLGQAQNGIFFDLLHAAT